MGTRRERARARGPRAVVGAVVAISLASTVPAAGGAEGSAGGAGPVARAVVHQDPDAVRRYWTAARMRNAKPAELLLRDTVGRVAQVVEPRGAPRRLSNAEPVNESGFPNRVHGKVFFTIPGDGNFVCSGTVVRSRGHSLGVTAGHCVYDDVTNQWVTNWAFVPAYRNGNRPFGTWPATKLASTDGWVLNENFSYDVGMATIARNANGEGVEDVVGARGIAFNQSRNQNFHAFGYPAAPTVAHPEFNGQRLYRCISGRTGDFDPGGSGPDMIEINCNMSGGSSGGGWVISNEFVNSVVSLGSGSPVGGNFLDGPYFGAAIEQLYDQSRGETRRCGGAPVTNLGTTGPDSLAGDGGADSIKLRAGADSGAGRGGPDRLCGGKGRDHLIGGPGFDVCKGGAGHDTATSCEKRRSIP